MSGETVTYSLETILTRSEGKIDQNRVNLLRQVRNPARERSRNLNREVWESPSVYGGEDVNLKDYGRNSRITCPTLNTSATVHAWAKAPLGVKGALPSKISLKLPIQLSRRWSIIGVKKLWARMGSR